MTGAEMSGANRASVDRAREILSRAASVSVLTGAGISTDSGIPDFRGPNGVWTRNPGAEKRSTIDHYLNDPQVRRDAWQIRVESEMFNAAPNEGHRALVELERSGRLHTLVTQNIDGLHVIAGSHPDNVVEIHGTVHRWECVACGARGPMDEALDRVRAGEVDPPCLICGGLMVPIALEAGRSVIIVNAEPTPFDHDATAVVRGSASAVLPAMFPTG